MVLASTMSSMKFSMLMRRPPRVSLDTLETITAPLLRRLPASGFHTQLLVLLSRRLAVPRSSCSSGGSVLLEPLRPHFGTSSPSAMGPGMGEGLMPRKRLGRLPVAGG